MHANYASGWPLNEKTSECRGLKKACTMFACALGLEFDISANGFPLLSLTFPEYESCMSLR